MPRLDDYERVEHTTRAGLRAWLEEHHTRDVGVWLVTYKKSVRPDRHLPYDDIVEEAICFGWIDSTVRALDAERSMLLLTPRKKGSPWSAVNKRRVAKLTRAGLLAEPGLAVLAAAKRDGSWTLLDEVERLEIPPDLAKALRARRARTAWDALAPSKRKPLLWQIKCAKTPATRTRRVEAAVAAAVAAAGARA
jgi:uncharacterized protein YdeI (YjbR/CyaY-like superfamily)